MYYFYDAHKQPKPYIWVDNEELLRYVFELHWKAAPYLAFDTEFKQCETFFPKTSLIQVSDGRNTWLVDVLRLCNLGHSIEPVFDILVAPSCIKVFHACKEDIRVFHRLFGDRIAALGPIFDTQIAASQAPHSANIVDYARTQGDELQSTTQLGYAKLVKYLLPEAHEHRPVSKEQQRSDWIARPLREEQLDYAAEDVLHLIEMYWVLIQAFPEEEQALWRTGHPAIQQYIREFVAPDHEKIFLKAFCRTMPTTSHAGEDDPIHTAWRLFVYRETKARSINRARKQVLSDEQLKLVAHGRADLPHDIHEYDTVSESTPLSPNASLYRLRITTKL